MAAWRWFATTKRHGTNPEIIERPVGTTLLYIVVFLSVVGTIAGLMPMTGDCKLECVGDSGHYSSTLAAVSAAVGVLAVAVLVWSRRHERRGDSR